MPYCDSANLVLLPGLGGEQRHQRRPALQVRDGPFDRQPAVDTGDDDTDQEEHLDVNPGSAGISQPPDQSGGKKAVVEPLVGGQLLNGGFPAFDVCNRSTAPPVLKG